MALRLLLVVAVVVVAAASCRAGLADPAVSALPGLPVAGLAVGFYKESCPEVEDLVLAEMRAIVEKDRTLGPAMLRFMFHDCLGCDASIMLKSRSNKGEQDAVPSYGFRGYEEIEADQGQGGGGVPAHRVMHGHHRPGRPGRRVPEQRAALRRRDRPPGRQGVGQVRRRQRSPAPILQHRRPQNVLQRQGLGLEGPRRPIREPHYRQRAVLDVRVGPALQLQREGGAGPVAGQGVRGEPAGGVRAGVQERHDPGGDGPDQPLRVRPELLPPRVQRYGALPLRPGAHGRPVDEGVRGADGRRGVARRVLRRLRGRHDQHGPARGAHGRQRGDQGDLSRVR